MLNTKRLTGLINATFVLIECVLLAIILFAKIPSTYFCFSAVCVGLVFGLITFSRQKYGEIKLLALAFTVIADIFLVIRYGKTDDYLDQVFGVCTFIFAQISYFLFLYFSCNNRALKITHIYVRAFLTIIAPLIAWAVLKSSINLLVIVTMVYFANLFLNTVFAFIEFYKHPVFAIGLLAFIFCDLFIGADIGAEMFLQLEPHTFLYKITHTDFNYAWLFYVISQTLIVLSLSVRIDIYKNRQEIK